MRQITPFDSFQVMTRKVATATGPSPVPEGRVSRPRPWVPTDSPSMGWVKKWHLTPWKHTSFLDVALADDSTDNTDDSGDGSGTGWADVVNNLVTQAGSVFTARSLPAGVTGFVPKPMPGQVVPKPAASSAFGMSTSTLALVAAAVLGGFLLLKKR